MSSAEPLPDLPIFPLPSVQMFPHAVLPLHVFEPRYRALVRDALAGARLVGLPILEPGFEAEYDGRPPVRRVCGIGRLVAHEPLPDGRANILLEGVTRARIVEELPPDAPYRVVRVERLDDVVPPGFDAHGAMGLLTALVDQLARKLPGSGGDSLRELARSQPSPGALTDVLAAALVSDAEERQHLIETLDVAARVERVSGKLAEMLAQVGDHRGPMN